MSYLNGKYILPPALLKKVQHFAHSRWQVKTKFSIRPKPWSKVIELRFGVTR